MAKRQDQRPEVSIHAASRIIESALPKITNLMQATGTLLEMIEAGHVTAENIKRVSEILRTSYDQCRLAVWPEGQE